MTDDEQRATVLREALADQIERDFPQVNAGISAAIRHVPRHRFIPEVDLETAYVDDAVITRRDKEGRSISSISQPSLVAQMLDMLDLRPGQRVLEIGAGTGYCAALLTELVGSNGHVTTIDLDPEITHEAHRNLDTAGYGRVTVTCGDGALGDPTGAPWDRIIVSVGAWEPAPEWIAQLASDGKLVQPLSLGRIQRITALEPTGYGLCSTELLCGGFLAQRGRDAHPRTTLRLNEEITIESSAELDIDAETAMNLLESEPMTIWSGTELAPPGRFDRLIVYLALHHAAMFTMTAPREFLPGALRAWKTIYVIYRDGALAHLALRPVDAANTNGSHEIGVRAYGLSREDLAVQLADDVRAWGRIQDADPQLEVYLKTRSPVNDWHRDLVLEKRHSHIRVVWPTAFEHRGDDTSERIVEPTKLAHSRMQASAASGGWLSRSALRPYDGRDSVR